MRRDWDVVVVGAGLAGLAAAVALFDEDVEVVVVEARERVGGRVWSTTLDNRAIVELGAEWIMPGDDALVGLADRFGVAMVEAGVDFRLREAWGAQAPTHAEQVSFLEAAERARASVEDARGRTVGDLLEATPGTSGQRTAVAMRLQGTFAIELDRVALRAADADGAFGSAPAAYRRMAKGNQRLPVEMAYALPEVRLGFAADTIVRDAGGVAVRSGPHEVRGRAAIVAVPAPIAARLRYEPDLPPEVVEALRERPMGVASKLAVATKGRPARRARQSTELPMWCWVADGKGGAPRRCVTSFAGSGVAQDVLQTASGRVGPWLERLREMNPDLELVGEPLMYSWAGDPYTLGAYAAWDDESLDRDPLLREPVEDLVFAGEHTAGPGHAGSMEGAVRSGARAARQVLATL
jgi:monoamine oxidase